MRAASRSGGQTASSLPFKFRQHLRDFKIVVTALLVPVPASTMELLVSLDSAEREALARELEGEAGIWICTLAD